MDGNVPEVLHMKSLHPVCCGIDLHKDMLQACVLAGALDAEYTAQSQEFGTQFDDLQKLADWLITLDCPIVAMESTGAYWHPIYHVLSERGITCQVVNAAHIKNVPGRKSDIADAQWIAHALRYGFVRPSFVPPRDTEVQRMYTRTYASLQEERAANINRMEKLLQMNGFKLSSVVTDITSQTGIRILRHLAAHRSIDLRTVEKLRDPNCKSSPQVMHRALMGKMRPDVGQLLSFWLDLLEEEDKRLQQLSRMIEALFVPYQEEADIVDSIPGVAKAAAYAILAEIGTDMTQFPTSEHLSSWAGLSPRSHESAGKKSPHASCRATNT